MNNKVVFISLLQLAWDYHQMCSNMNESYKLPKQRFPLNKSQPFPFATTELINGNVNQLAPRLACVVTDVTRRYDIPS